MADNITPAYLENFYASPVNTTPPQIVSEEPRYEILTAFHALQPQPPIDWIVDGLVSAGSVNIFYGESGSKKTWALLDMGVCVARGDDWLNFKTKACNVLIVDEDNGQRRMMRRLGEVLRGHNADENTPINCVSYAAFDFGKDDDLVELKNLIFSTKARLVIVDVLANVMPGRDENTVKDVLPVLLALRRIADQTQTAIILIHHANKSGGYRGTSAIKGALDALIFVDSKSGYDEIAFKADKTRDEKEQSFGATANFVSDSFWLTANQNVNRKTSFSSFTKAEKYVLLYLFQHGESTSKDMTDSVDPQVDPAQKSVTNAISGLKKAGFIDRTDKGGTSTGTYKLTSTGHEAAENF